MKVVIVILGVFSVALGIGLLMSHTSAVKIAKENEQHVDELVNYSNRLEETKSKVDELFKVNSTLETNLTVRSQDLASKSNDLVKTSAELAKTQKEAQAAAVSGPQICLDEFSPLRAMHRALEAVLTRTRLRAMNCTSTETGGALR